MTVALEKVNNGGLAEDFSRDRIDLIKRTYCKGSTDDELALFIEVCRRTRLSPETRQIFAVKRWDSREGREIMQIQISIDGFRVIAERSNKYAGQVGPLWCGKDGKWVDIWTQDGPPFAAKVGVMRSDFKEALWGVARWSGYVQTKKSGEVTGLWNKMPDLMIAKCAEALALRKAFPNDLSGLYTPDEMAQAGEVVTGGTRNQEPKTLAAAPEPERAAYTELHEKTLEAFMALNVDRFMLEDHIGMSYEQFKKPEFDKCRELFADLKAGKTTLDDLLVRAQERLGRRKVADGMRTKLETAFGTPSVKQ